MSQLHIYPLDASGAKLVLAFPYSYTLVQFVRTIPGREYMAKGKFWTVPGSPETIKFILERKPAGTNVVIDEGTKARYVAEARALHEAQAARDAGDSDIAFPYLTEPYAHQRAGLAFLANSGSAALFWEMGLGKTKTAIDYAEWLHARNVLVIAPNTVVRNWADEIAKHAGHHDYAILAGVSLAERARRLATARYSIVNTEALSHDVFAKAVERIEWDLVIVDESTRFKTHDARRTKALHRIGRHAAHRIALTGTPITGKASDAWSQMEFVRPGTFGEWYRFRDQFLEEDWFGGEQGVKPGMAKELTERIGRRSYRVLKADVLDLPPKVYSDRRVVLTPIQRRAYNQMRDELRVEIDAMEKVNASNVLAVLLRLTQITAGLVGQAGAYTWLPDAGKVRELDELLNDELRGEQVVVFGVYQEELRQLAARYVKWEPGLQYPPIVYGPTPEAIRHDLIAEFQRGDRRLLFAQIRTGGIGINLTAAQTAIYHTRTWSLEEWLQSQDRLHRIGQTGTVSILPLIAEDTIDEEIAAALEGKQKLADTLTGDGLRKLIASVLGR